MFPLLIRTVQETDLSRLHKLSVTSTTISDISPFLFPITSTPHISPLLLSNNNSYIPEFSLNSSIGNGKNVNVGSINNYVNGSINNNVNNVGSINNTGTINNSNTSALNSTINNTFNNTKISQFIPSSNTSTIERTKLTSLSGNSTPRQNIKLPTSINTPEFYESKDNYQPIYQLFSWSNIVKHYFSREQKPFSHFWAGTDINHNILGCIGLLYISKYIAEIQHFYVDPNFCHKKIGLRLFAVLLEYAVKQEYNIVRISLKSDKMVKFLIKIGFTKVEKEKTNLISNSVLTSYSIDLTLNKDSIVILANELFNTNSVQVKSVKEQQKYYLLLFTPLFNRNLQNMTHSQKQDLQAKAVQITDRIVEFTAKNFGTTFSCVTDDGNELDSKVAVQALASSESGLLQLADELAQIKLNLMFIVNENEQIKKKLQLRLCNYN